MIVVLKDGCGEVRYRDRPEKEEPPDDMDPADGPDPGLDTGSVKSEEFEDGDAAMGVIDAGGAFPDWQERGDGTDDGQQYIIEEMYEEEHQQSPDEEVDDEYLDEKGERGRWALQSPPMDDGPQSPHRVRADCAGGEASCRKP